MAEMEILNLQITPDSILLIRGRISRQPCESGHIALILNEVPRLIVAGGSHVLSKIGFPIALINACEQNKYSDYDKRYPGNSCFSIPYSLDFRQHFF